TLSLHDALPISDVLKTALGCQPRPPATLYVGPRTSDSPLRFTRIAAGEYHSLALQSNGTLVAWGSNSSGQTNVPSGLGRVVALAAGDNFSLALKADGTIAAWGDNASGQTSGARA